MHSADYLNTVFESLLTTQKIPELKEVQMQAFLHYLFHSASTPLRLQVAEVVFRNERSHAHALDLFLACVLPLAERCARRRAARFLHPSEWRVEVMYDGAVSMVIELFHKGQAREDDDTSFRRYLLRTLVYGTLRYFTRAENLGVTSDTDVLNVRPFDNLRQGWGGCRRTALNTVEERMITRQLLEQVLNFPELPEEVRVMLQCIANLGPDNALKAHAFTASGDPDSWKRERARRPILDPDAIAAAMNSDRRTVHRKLLQARTVLRQAFNSDGKLFQRH